MLAQAVSQALIPRVTHWRHTEPDAGIALYRKTLTLIGGLMSCLFGIGIALAGPILRLAYGSQYSPARPALQFLLLAMLLFSWGVLGAAGLIGLRRERTVTLISLAGLAAGVLAGLVGLVMGGWLVAALAATLFGNGCSGLALTAASLVAYRRIVRQERTG